MKRRSVMSSRRRRALGAGLSALVGVGAALTLGPPAVAAGTTYVALGDSYSSGTGTRSYISDGTSCQRSVYAYPSLDAAALGLTLSFRACSGATVADVTNTQLSALSSATAYVTISVGGNDAGFCERAVDVRAAELAQQLQRRGRLGADDHQHQDPGPARDALLLDPGEGPERPRHRRRLPPHLQRRGLQRPHVVLAHGGVPPQRDGRPAQLEDGDGGGQRRASPSSTRPRGSSGTPSATTSSGSTACRARSPRATTPTSPATGTATPS